MSKRRKTSDRVRGLLVMLPWLVERGRANIDEMARTFGLDRAPLVSDLTLATFCGTPPYSPLELIEIYFSDDEVWVEVPRLFTKPFRLSVEEAFALKAIGGAALAVSGADTSSALSSALAKLPALGDEASVVVRQPNDPNVEALTQACIMREALKIKYFRPQIRFRTTREIVPMRVWVDGDHWYVDAFDVSKEPQAVRDKYEQGPGMGKNTNGTKLLCPPQASAWNIERVGGLTDTADNLTDLADHAGGASQ